MQFDCVCVVWLYVCVRARTRAFVCMCCWIALCWEICHSSDICCGFRKNEWMPGSKHYLSYWSILGQEHLVQESSQLCVGYLHSKQQCHSLSDDVGSWAVIFLEASNSIFCHEGYFWVVHFLLNYLSFVCGWQLLFIGDVGVPLGSYLDLCHLFSVRLLLRVYHPVWKWCCP